MTTTVTVKTRALGATVETNGQSTELTPHEERQFHIDEGSQSFTVSQHEQPTAKTTDEAPADKPATQQTTGSARPSSGVTSKSSEQPTG